ncbi:MAG: hypothetical protein AAF349_26795 [Cyanobacteria bacterium P01_A01_bin.68]
MSLNSLDSRNLLWIIYRGELNIVTLMLNAFSSIEKFAGRPNIGRTVVE